MMRGNKKQKFHEALLHMLYPPPPPKDEDDQEPTGTLNQSLNLSQIPDELDEDGGKSTSSSDADGEEGDGPKKLTRAQRKRLRRKKLKEAASRRSKIIGPLLPTTASDDGVEVVGNEPPSVRQNASETDDNAGAKTNRPVLGETPHCSKQNKLKQRRMAKKLAGESVNSSSTGTETAMNAVASVTRENASPAPEIS
ncbi:hypothetical protein ACH5RR_011560 [Cinchona calisaya]|uniref:Uncharacterized protein n=1 Tax=Cinchona calisaya TaxID=153742 RepID=A0ABD3A585_9GENT